MIIENLQCKYCDTEMKETIYGNYSIRCPYCQRLLKHVSDFGFGPVTPFYICVGSEVVGVVESNYNKYRLKFQGREIILTKTYFDAVHEAEEYIINALGMQIPTVEFPIVIQGGSLFFYGESFGRPYDNFHKIRSSHYDGELLIITFDQWEELFVYHPKDIENSERELRIGSAAKVKWSYIPYGSVRTRVNHVYQVRNGGVWKNTNQGEYVTNGSVSEPAILLTR